MYAFNTFSKLVVLLAKHLEANNSSEKNTYKVILQNV